MASATHITTRKSGQMALPFEAFLSPDGLHMNDCYNCFAKALADAIADAATPRESSSTNANATTGETR